MKISYNIINHYVPGVFQFPQIIKDKCNQMGMEVENMTTTAEGDTIYDLEITPNRPDQLNYVGIIREILACTDTNINILDKIPVHKYDSNYLPLKNIMSDMKGCPIFLSRNITGLNIKESPQWLKMILTAHNINSVNVIVDITNFVMLELGQPLHAYDQDKLQGDIVIDMSKPDDKILCLDGTERILTGKEVMVKDEAGNNLCIGGVIGGEKCKITDSTTNIILESAYFDAVSIRYTSRRHKFSSEASYRFERGADPRGCQLALDRATDLILQECGGQIITQKGYDNFGYQGKEITLEKKYITRLLGILLTEEFMVNSFHKLGFKIKENNPEFIRVEVPSRRINDVKYDTCLVEELGKIYNYDLIPEKMPEGELKVTQQPMKQYLEDMMRQYLINLGLHEVINFAFGSPKVFEKFELDTNSKLLDFIELEAPLGEDFSVMRTSLIPGLLRNLEYNLNRGEDNIKIFEYGRIFCQNNAHQLPVETNIYGGLIASKIQTDTRQDKYREFNIYDLKSIIWNLLSEINVQTEKLILKKTCHELLDNNAGADIYLQNQLIGYFGALKKGAYENKKLKYQVFIWELNFDLLVSQITNVSCSRFEQFSLYPSVYKDLSFVVPINFSSGQIITEMYNIGGELLKKVELYDLFASKNIPAGFVSMTFALEFNSSHRSLTNEEIIEIFNNIIKNITDKFGIKLRE